MSTDRTTLSDILAAAAAVTQACVSTQHEPAALTAEQIANRIYNAGGSKYITRRGLQRASLTTVTLKGVDLAVEYTVSGAYCPATHDDPGCMPCADVRTVSVGGVDITRLMGEHISDIEERIEAQWVQP
jgi:hypothetical protein